MIRKYIQAAMEHARYEILQDEGSYYGEIRDCPGVYSNASTLEQCRNELEETLEEWILFRVYKDVFNRISMCTVQSDRCCSQD